MASPAIEESLARAEVALASGQGLSGTGFWKAVSEVKRRPELVDRYADRIAAIDRQVHRRRALLVVPFLPGTVIAVAAMVAGLVLVGLAYRLSGGAAVLVFLLGFVALIATTHGLGHLVVGRLLGIRFTDWYIAAVIRPQPGVKVDYSSYLRTNPRRRAWMHASGALVTKTLPFLLIGAVVAADLPGWLVWALVGFGLLQLVTDLVWSTKSSDWKRFRRELESAQSI